MKKCCKCKIEKSKNEFCKDKNRKDGLDVCCKECKNTYRQNNPNLEYHREYWKEYIKTDHGKEIQRKNKLEFRYGISLEDYDQMFEAQNGKCKICGTEENNNRRFSVDHNHETGKVRGLLCYRCNTSLGWFENNKDSVSIYLKGE